MTSRDFSTARKGIAAGREHSVQGRDPGSRKETESAGASMTNQPVGFNKTRSTRKSGTYAQSLKRVAKEVQMLKSDRHNFQRRLDELARDSAIVKRIGKVTPEPVLSKKLDPSRSRAKRLPREVLSEYSESRADHYYDLFGKKSDQ